MEILQLVLWGLALGSIYALGAIGVSLTFGVLRFANFAHGDLMTVGAFGTLAVYHGTARAVPLWLASLGGIVAAAAVAVTVDKTLFKRFRRANPMILLISSFGVGLMIRSAVQLIWGPDTQFFDTGIKPAIRWQGLRLKADHITIFFGTIVLMLVVHGFLRYTRLGKAMRALSDNPDLARVSGIDTERVITYTWVLGAALAAMAGFFLALDTRLQPDMGWFALLPIFAAAILGGIGQPYGAIAGGFIIGVTQELSTLVLPTDYKPVVAFALMVLILIIRPTGIFRGKT